MICSPCRKEIDKIEQYSKEDPALNPAEQGLPSISSELEEAASASCHSQLSEDNTLEPSQLSDVLANIPHDETYCPPMKKKIKLPEGHAEDCEVLQKLKDKFQHPETSLSEQSQILTLAPDSWSTRKTATFFGCSRRFVNSARTRVEEHGTVGVLSAKDPRPGKKLPHAIEELVRGFYESDDNSSSRLLPGKKDFVSVKQHDGTRKHIQKRLMLCNLQELYAEFKRLHPGKKVGFSKFCQLRPKQCVLAGDSGTHTVCVCIYHQNVKLMIDGGNIATLTKDTDMHLGDYKDCLKYITCKEPSTACYFNNACKDCPSVDEIKDHLKDRFEYENIESIQYQSWGGTDRATMKTETLSVEDFVDELCKQLLKLKTHDYVAKRQAAYLSWRKANLIEGEILVQCDFAENYAFVAQDAAQAFHWNNNQASINTAVCYYKIGDEMHHESFAVISDDLNHNTVAVYAFQKLFIQHMQQKNIPLKKIIYFTDGASQHFKNKYNFANLLRHTEDFGIPAEWHFFATAHGKGPCDGTGGNLKRLAARASLQRDSAHQILTPKDLYTWAKETLKNTTILYSPKENHQHLKTFLESRFSSAKTILGTLGYHSFVPVNDVQLSLKRFSLDPEVKLFPKKV